MKVWITKYALTQNIYEVEVIQSTEYQNMVSEPGAFEIYHGEGKNWHRTKEGAIKRAEQMRTAKIASLKKSIAKMERLNFA